MTAEKVTLTAEKEAPLITLDAKAGESKLPDSLLHEECVVRPAERIDYDLHPSKVDRNRMIGCRCAHIFDGWTREFWRGHPRATVLHRGGGSTAGRFASIRGRRCAGSMSARVAAKLFTLIPGLRRSRRLLRCRFWGGCAMVRRRGRTTMGDPCDAFLTEESCLNNGCTVFATELRFTVDACHCVEHGVVGKCFETVNDGWGGSHIPFAIYRVQDGVVEVVELGHKPLVAPNGWHLCQGEDVPAACGCACEGTGCF